MTAPSLPAELRPEDIEQLKKLAKIVGEYLSEIDNPVPDYSYRASLRDRMRRTYKAMETT